MLPATISLAIPLYEKWELLQKNAVAILSGILAGVLTSLGSIVAMAWILKLDRAQAVTLLPKSVTTAIGMDVAAELGGMAALCGAVIIITGIIGNVLAETICKLFRITDPMAKGIAIGTSSHAGGTAKALEMGQVEGAMGGLAIAVAGVLTAFLTPLAANLLP
jgi:putative effector of murein hydrolase